MISYKVFDPNGNITVLVNSNVKEENRAEIACELMKKEPTAEQVGFISLGDESCDTVLNMAGGEFCGNATLCAAVNYCINTGYLGSVKVKVSGCEEILTVKVDKKNEGFTASTNMPAVKDYSVRNLEFNGINYNIPVVDLGGISHGIICEIGDIEKISSAIKKWCSDLDASALGLMLFNEEEKKVVPIVYVKNADTLFYENSCASGTTAIGYYLFKKYTKSVCEDIVQPRGVLNVKVDSLGKIFLTGDVKDFYMAN